MLMHDSKAGPETTPWMFVQRAGGCEVLPRGVGWVGALYSFHTVAAMAIDSNARLFNLMKII